MHSTVYSVLRRTPLLFASPLPELSTDLDDKVAAVEAAALVEQLVLDQLADVRGGLRCGITAQCEPVEDCQWPHVTNSSAVHTQPPSQWSQRNSSAVHTPTPRQWCGTAVHTHAPTTHSEGTYTWASAGGRRMHLSRVVPVNDGRGRHSLYMQAEGQLSGVARHALDCLLDCACRGADDDVRCGRAGRHVGRDSTGNAVTF